ncbi:MAG: VanZ family protein [Sedimentisphaerales bacterium]|nr:VanZ family protein [Sedimentisphaerales bacterium]
MVCNQITRTEKYFRIVALLVYWATLVILAHIQIPQPVRQTSFPDKALHIIAYMGLTLLLWGVVRPGQRVNWSRASAWLIMLVILLYGLVDEWTQGFTKDRTADIRDLVADIIGASATLGILTILSFWDAALVLLGAGLIGLTSLTRIELSAVMPAGGIVFYGLVYGTFSAILACTRSRSRPLLLIVLPACLLGLNCLLGLVTGRGPGIWDILVAMASTLLATMVCRFVMARSR